MLFFPVVLSFVAVFSCAFFNIERDFGAVSTDYEPEVEVADGNARAIMMAFSAASNSKVRVVFVPRKTFYFSAIQLYNMTDIRFQIDGILIAHSNLTTWKYDDEGNALHQFYLERMSSVTFSGNGGVINGQGYNWWWYAVSCGFPTVEHPDTRGSMIKWAKSRDIVIEGLSLINSPMFHIDVEDCDNVTVRDFSIFVNTSSQLDILQEFGYIDRSGIHMFPLNTDGVDLKASNSHVYNGTIVCYDDGVAIKPCRSNWEFCKQCSGGFVHDIYAVFTVGMTIGSVPPNEHENCVADLVFKDIRMDLPLKGIYIKSNPGVSGTGLIQNITYENIILNRSVWWPMWIGPQQQNQPDGTYTGCDMMYPLKGDCPTNPLVTMRDFTFRNVSAVHGLNKYAGVILCNESNPCTNFIFDNVQFQEGLRNDYTYPFITSNVEGECVSPGLCSPDPFE